MNGGAAPAQMAHIEADKAAIMAEWNSGGLFDNKKINKLLLYEIRRLTLNKSVRVPYITSLIL